MYSLQEDRICSGNITVPRDKNVFDFSSDPVSTLFNLISFAKKSKLNIPAMGERKQLIKEEYRKLFDDNGELIEYGLDIEELLEVEMRSELDESVVNQIIVNNNDKRKIGVDSLAYVSSESHPNDDWRGVRDLDTTFPWAPRVKVENPTYQQAIAMFFAIKSHKWDKWYEMLDFDGTEVDLRDPKNPIVYLSFDYGS